MVDATMHTADAHHGMSPFIFCDQHASKSKLWPAHDEANSTDAKDDLASISEATTEFNTPPVREKGPDMSKALHALDEAATSTDGGNEIATFGALSSHMTGPEDNETCMHCKSVPMESGFYPKMLLLHLRGTVPLSPLAVSRSVSSPVCGIQSKSTQKLRYTTRRIDDLQCARDNSPDSSQASAPGACEFSVEQVHKCFSQLSADSIDLVTRELTSRATTPEHLTILIHELFNKATSQHHVVPLYAELCVRLGADSTMLALFGPTGEKAFRKVLLKECQIRFTEMSGKRKARGIMKFIGELLLRGMISEKLLVEIAEELLRSWEECVEAAFEPLVTLLVVVGPHFDTPRYRYYTRLLGVYSSMDELTKNETIPEAMRMLLHSVLELRSAGWVSKPRRFKG